MSSIYDKQRSNLIRKYEGFEPEAYRLHGENFNTIGYGSTSYEDGSAVGNQDKISKEQAQELLDFHIERTREPVSTLVGYKKLPPGAQVAVDSFAYNTGPNFIYDDEGFGTINRAIRAGDAKAVADALPLYDNGGLAGLVRRRAEEAELAITPAMDLVDSTLANDRTRAFGTEAVLDGKTVVWAGKDYGWQSPSSFSSIKSPTPIESQKPSTMNLFGWIK
jgi:GH24 family phage-related lysozyme (muramidase)